MAGAASVAVHGFPRDSTSAPSVSFTFDDPKVSDQPLLSQFEIADRILTALKKAEIRAALFVCGKRVDSETGRALIKKWDEAAHMIGNHTYSHLNYNLDSTPFEVFSSDVVKAEPLINQCRNYARFLRFPYLKEGDTTDKRDRIRNWMREQHYRSAYVTIDASDWYIDDRLKARLSTNIRADLKPYREFYLDHLWNRSVYYDDLARKLTGRSIHHTLLLHHALVNGLFLADLIAMYKSKGWDVMSARDAYDDPIFSAQPKTIPAGESLIWSLAKETGKYEPLRYPGEDAKYEEPEMNKRGL